MYGAYYTNPYDREKEPENWRRWNIGEEDGSRNLQPRGRSVAYKDGFNAGTCNRQVQEITNTIPPSSRPA